MRLISPKKMGEKERRSLRLCLKSSRLAVAREELIASISEGMAGIEEGVRIIDQGLPVPKLGEVDLVAEDVRGRLVLITFADRLDAEGLGRALIRSDWAVDNFDLLEHVYSRSFPQEVRSWEMVGDVAPEAASLLSRMDVSPAEVFACDGVDLGGERWLVVRRYDPEEGVREALSAARSRPSAPPATQAPSVMRNPREAGTGSGTRLQSVLTREEIDDFFDTSGYEEEVTSRVLDPSKF